MGKIPYEDPKTRHFFDGRKSNRLGSPVHPAQISVQDQARADEIKAILAEHGWTGEVGIDPDREEDISQLDRLLNPPVPVSGPAKVGRNEPCPCGSGKKFKKCCG